MGDSSRHIDLETLISYSDDLLQILRDKKDVNNITHCLQNSQALQSSCDSDFIEAQNLLQDYKRRIDECEEKAEAAKSEVLADVELDRLQKELEEELEKERVLMENLRVLTEEINGLDLERISIEDRMQVLKKFEHQKLREKMTLSMYASVTNIIPNLDDNSKIRGYIVNREKKVVDKFEFDSAEMPTYDACANIWKMINIS